MARTAETRRNWNGPAVLSAGFRPFFLLAAVWAVLAIAIWPFFFTGERDVPTAFAAVDGHGHVHARLDIWPGQRASRVPT